MRRRPLLFGLAGLIGLMLFLTRSRLRSDETFPVGRMPIEAALAQCGSDAKRQYGLMIDAGSTGSRIHIYDFAVCNGKTILRGEGFHQLKPGLSSFARRPHAAAESLRPLLEEAMKAVPASEQKCTPIAVKATAGLRLLGPAESEDILREVHDWLETEWPFPVKDVSVMEGRDEGVYAWITINYLLGLLDEPARKTKRMSAAVLDLGGASTQIVFEPEFEKESKLQPGDHVYDLKFAEKPHVLYQHSYLGFGLMQARRSVNNLVGFNWLWSQSSTAKDWDDLGKSDRVPHPCMFKGSTKEVLLDPPTRAPVTVTAVGTGAGYEACSRLVGVTMQKDSQCEVGPCAFGGVYQPSLMETFGRGPIYALSYFYDRLAPLGLGVNSAPFTLLELKQLAMDVCLGPAHALFREHGRWHPRFRSAHLPEAIPELEDRPEYCLDLVYMYQLLSLGYDLSDSRQLRIAKQLDDVELGWALGAGIALLDGEELTCRA